MRFPKSALGAIPASMTATVLPAPAAARRAGPAAGRAPRARTSKGAAEKGGARGGGGPGRAQPGGVWRRGRPRPLLPPPAAAVAYTVALDETALTHGLLASSST